MFEFQSFAPNDPVAAGVKPLCEDEVKLGNIPERLATPRFGGRYRSVKHCEVRGGSSECLRLDGGFIESKFPQQFCNILFSGLVCEPIFRQGLGLILAPAGFQPTD
jgi:hypothetical protein